VNACVARTRTGTVLGTVALLVLETHCTEKTNNDAPALRPGQDLGELEGRVNASGLLGHSTFLCHDGAAE
jgi:hypothetical protein